MEFNHYLIICAVIFVLLYPITLLFHKQNGIIVKDEEHLIVFFACLITSVLPLFNLFLLLITSVFVLESYSEKLKKQDEQKSELETTSFETLLRILHLYRNSNNNKEFQTFINRTQYNIDILRQKFNETDYKELLISYEFTFARIESIIEESNNLNNDAYNKVLVSSIEVIESFLEECQLLTEKIIKIEQETEKTILNRLLSEINEEKVLLNRKSPKI